MLATAKHKTRFAATQGDTGGNLSSEVQVIKTQPSSKFGSLLQQSSIRLEAGTGLLQACSSTQTAQKSLIDEAFEVGLALK
jgi:hypothetical protein